MGRSAGAMTASRDFGLTYEPNPALTTAPRTWKEGILAFLRVENSVGFLALGFFVYL